MIRYLVVAALACAGTSVATGAVAQSAAIGGLQCTGKPVTIRVSTIKPGQFAAFRKAVQAHQAWYAGHGNATKVALVRLAKRSGTGAAYDDGEAMTIVSYDSKPQPAHDGAYQAFVDAYQASSSVKSEYRGCQG